MKFLYTNFFLCIAALSVNPTHAMDLLDDLILEGDIRNNSWHSLIGKAIDKHNQTYQENEPECTMDDVAHIRQLGLRRDVLSHFPTGYTTGDYLDIHDTQGQKNDEHIEKFWSSAPRIYVMQSRNRHSNDDKPRIKIHIDTTNIEQNYHDRMPYWNQHPIKCVLLASCITAFGFWGLNKAYLALMHYKISKKTN